MGIFVSLIKNIPEDEGEDDDNGYQLVNISSLQRSFSNRNWKKGSSNKNLKSTGKSNRNFEAYDNHSMYVSPQSIEALCQMTKFSKKEIKLLYRGFKQQCPTGSLNFETFREIYGQFFPEGNPTQYAFHVFNSFDKRHSGTMDFEDFVKVLSCLSRGSVEDKLKWAFSLYDINGDGYITKEEMTEIIKSVYELLNKMMDNSLNLEAVIHSHVERVFKKMDLNKDGIVTSEEFVTACIQDTNITRSIGYLDTILT